MHSLLVLAGLLTLGGSPAEDVCGLVTDQAGKPVAGATVVLVRPGTQRDAGKVQAALTGEDGRFALASADGSPAGGTVVAYKPGLAVGAEPAVDPGARNQFPRGGPEVRDLRIRLL